MATPLVVVPGKAGPALKPAMDPADAELGRAADLHDRGERREALRGYRRAAVLMPGRIEAVGSIALVSHELGDRQATTWLRRTVDIDPANPAALHNLALARHGLMPGEIARVLRRLLSLAPAHVDAARRAGQIEAGKGDLETSRRRFRRALAVDGKSAPVLLALAGVLRQLLRPHEAVQAGRRALCMAPSQTALLNDAGAAAFAEEADGEAEAFFRRGLAVEGGHPVLLGNLARTMVRLGRPSEAIRYFHRALAEMPESVDALARLAFSESFRSADRRAMVLSRRALAIDALAALPRVLHAAIRRHNGHLTEAAAECRRALACDPGLADGHMTLGTAHQEMGALAAAVADYRRALAGRRNYVDAERNLLYAILHMPDTGEADVFRAAVAFARRHEPSRDQVLPSPDNDRDPDRPLRIAYVSSDFRDHPNRWFMNAIFEHRDRKASSIICYHADRRHDRETAWIRDRVEAWREVKEMTDAAIARLLREDGIDIAVFLGGRFDGNRPLVAAYRPAPVQVSYLDGGTSGLRQMDYWITDGVLHPEGRTEELFTEELLRLPSFYSFTRPMPDLPLLRLPARDRGNVTFGSFAQPSRVTDRVIATWAKILDAVPGSRLFLKSRNRYGDDGNRRRLVHGFAARGVDPARIAVEAANDSHLDHLARYRAIDIALDTFPFSGATTTFEALWMGVPVVTMPGTRFVARMATSILTAAGHPELIAPSEEAYVSTASGLAGDLDRLDGIHRSLRDDVAASPLCDGPAYARSMDRAYRSVWRRWCAQPRVEPS